MNSIENIRNEFPILSRKIHSKSLIYFDNAATTQKPNKVINSMVDYYSTYNANIHRGVHSLSQEATLAYENARKKVQKYINATHSHEIIFTSGTTEGINLIANGLTPFLQSGDTILLLATEHHSNIVPWQLLCQRTGAIIKPIPVNEKGQIIFSEFEKLLSENVKVVSCQHISNALGNIFPIAEIIKKAQNIGAITIIDGAQSCSHYPIDIQKLNPDFFVTSGHKMYAPTGIGFLYGKEEWLKKMPPYQGGGEMIQCVAFEKSSYAELPHKFEAGTPNICGAIALGYAIDFIQEIGFDFIHQHQYNLLKYATDKLKEIEGVVIYGEDILSKKSGVISFNISNIHPYDIGTILDKMGIAVRTGHHCAQPVMDFYQIPGTIRISFAIYNTIEEIDVFINALKKAKTMLE